MEKSHFAGALCACSLLLCFQSAHANSIPPAADANGPYVINAGDDLTLDARGTSDADHENSLLMFEWDVNGDDDLSELITGEMPTVSWSTLEGLGLVAGHFGTVGLLVTDPNGNSDFATTTLTINAIPIPAALWLFGSGLLGLVGIARRKKAA